MKKIILISIAAYIIVMATISVNATTDYFSDAEYLCGFIDKQGNVLGEIKFDEVKAFGKDLAPVSVDGKWGLMNKLGELVMPLEYLDAYSSDTGGGVVWTGAEWIYVDKDGKVVLKSSMKYPEFIDWESKIVNAPEPEEETERSGYYCGYGIYFVSENNQYGFVNAKGEKLSDLDYEYPGERPIRFDDGLLSAIGCILSDIFSMALQQ
jgi:ribosomal protein L24E